MEMALKGRDVDDVEKNRRSAGTPERMPRTNAGWRNMLTIHPHRPFRSYRWFSISEDDPRYIDAVAEANRRFDEFLAAFMDRTPADLFEIKSAFRDDFGKEFMWSQSLSSR